LSKASKVDLSSFKGALLGVAIASSNGYEEDTHFLALRKRHKRRRRKRLGGVFARHIRQHTSAYVSIRQHTSAYVSIRQHTSAYVSIALRKRRRRRRERHGVNEERERKGLLHKPCPNLTKRPALPLGTSPRRIAAAEKLVVKHFDPRVPSFFFLVHHAQM
jgi:hypothetical protein